MPQQIHPLTESDSNDLEAKRSWVRDHYEPSAQHKYDSVAGKLALLDAIISNKWVEPTETLKLQCLGIAFGDALAQETSLEWAAVEDEYGRDPALIQRGTSIVLFPQTSISKRIEAGEAVHVRELFAAACKTLQKVRDELA